MVRHKLTSLLPQPVRLQLATAPQALSMEIYAALVDSFSVPACLCGINAAAPTDQPCPSTDPLEFHVLQQKEEVGAEARRDLPLAPVSRSTEARLASVEASLPRLEAIPARSPALIDVEVSFYHRRFGDGARNCRLPQPRTPRNLQRLRRRSLSVPQAAVTRPRPPGEWAPSLPPPRPQPTGGLASVPPIYLRASAYRAPIPPSVGCPTAGASHSCRPPSRLQPTRGCALYPPPAPRQPAPASSLPLPTGRPHLGTFTPASSDSTAPSSPQHPERLSPCQRPLVCVRYNCYGGPFPGGFPGRGECGSGNRH
ncbi:hypothetical protein E2C01_055863 [Portunus trituberculatus]|uniref:Uncharacterized protein n=1 Tax=Portunus trituberculatus TaxID=210409 RepID=A0A5B7GX95_PORTR|nr:hypothetical protein [Portunus trituberculatus]